MIGGQKFNTLTIWRPGRRGDVESLEDQVFDLHRARSDGHRPHGALGTFRSILQSLVERRGPVGCSFDGEQVFR